MEDEVERRNQKQLSLRLRRSGLDATKTMESFDFQFNASINRQEIYDLATCRYVERAEGIWLVGPAGVGKSHLAQALGHEAVRRGYDVLFLRTSRMLNHLNGGRADSSYEKRLLTYLRPDVLILDDFGLKPMRPPASEDLYEVIDGRYQKGATILTTNRAFSEWLELFDQAVLGSAALDRLAHGATQLVLTGESYRAGASPHAPHQQSATRNPTRARLRPKNDDRARLWKNGSRGCPRSRPRQGGHTSATPLFVHLRGFGRVRVCASGSGRKLRFFLNVRSLRHRHESS